MHPIPNLPIVKYNLVTRNASMFRNTGLIPGETRPVYRMTGFYTGMRGAITTALEIVPTVAVK